MTWNAASNPPVGVNGCWGEPVIAITNMGNVFLVSWYNGDHGGCWQRPAAMEEGEVFVRWTAFPEDID